MADIFYAGMPDWLDRLNQLAQGQLLPIQVDWDAAPGSVLAILNKPLLAAVATSGSKGDVGLGAVDNTSDANKPVSIAQQAALDGKAAKGSKADAGLPNVDNTSDANKPVSIAQQAALDGKANKGSKADVGLPNVDNTSDANKPVSIAQQTALNLKANSANPSTTGTWSHTGGPLSLNSNTSSWAVFRSGVVSSSFMTFIKGGSDLQIGYVGADGGAAVAGGTGENFVVRGTSHLVFASDGRVVRPHIDAENNLGISSYRWGNSYFSVAPTITSDAREKDMFRAFGPAEIAAAADLARAIGVYRWKTAIALKGDDAREHIGPTVQAAIQIMEAHGLDPFNYGFICYDSWKGEVIEHAAIEATDDREMQAAWTETIPAGDRYAFRYDELNQFIAAGLEARQTAIEARLAALEGAGP